jgi:hypothetical protein
MKKFASIISFFLALIMLFGTFASCNEPEQTTGENEGQSTATSTEIVSDTEESNGENISTSEDETDDETEKQTETDEIEKLEGNFGASILYADEIMNGVQAG